MLVEKSSQIVTATVVIATYNRAAGIVSLLGDVHRQQLGGRRIELIVVDDGSQDETPGRLEAFQREQAVRADIELTLVRQPNQGQAVARQNGADRARGETLVFLDDDMRLASPGFLTAHLRHHAPGAPVVVLGKMLPPPEDPPRHAFEYFYERGLDRMYAGFESGRMQPQGYLLFTGNVSVARAVFIAAGGFSGAYRYAEDKELGLRIEARTAARFRYEPEALTHHYSTTPSFAAFCRRAHYYGFYDCEMQALYPHRPEIGPTGTLEGGWIVRRAICRVLQASPAARTAVSRGCEVLARLLARGGRRAAAAHCCGMIYVANYIAGVQSHQQREQPPVPVTQPA
jgi:glycosyltransferase involved in cell wall biosynthesis